MLCFSLSFCLQYFQLTAREGSGRSLRYKVSLFQGRCSIYTETRVKITRTYGSSSYATKKATPSLLWRLRKMGKVWLLPLGESMPVVLAYRHILTASLQSRTFITQGIRPPSAHIQPSAHVSSHSLGEGRVPRLPDSGQTSQHCAV